MTDYLTIYILLLICHKYGGRYGPGISEYFEEQNARIANKSLTDNGETFEVHLDTLGIINGCIDPIAQQLSSAGMYVNNTYGINLVPQRTVDEELQQFYKDDTGCLATLQACKAAAAAGDAAFTGSNATVNKVCESVNCEIGNAYYELGRSAYDIASPAEAPFPAAYYQGYLNQLHVQRALGVPINFTTSSSAVYNVFGNTADFQREDNHGGYLQDIASLLDIGVKVALIYGDRDFICNVSDYFP